MSKTKLEKLSILVDGERYLTVKQFAQLTKRSEQSVRFLTAKGNSVRRLKVRLLAGRVLIPAAEVTEFPFVSAGGQEVYHYDEEGLPRPLVPENKAAPQGA